MTSLTSAQAKALLPNYSFGDICVLARRGGYPRDEIFEKTLWLGWLCTTGNLSAVKEYLATLDFDEKKQILNTKVYEFYDGTVLHQTLYWNTGNLAIDMFQVLVEHGAEPMLDGYDELPWQNGGSLWIAPFGSEIGTRNGEEFEEVNQFLQEIYNSPQPTFEDTPVLPTKPSSQNAPIAARRLVFEDEDEIEQDIDNFAKMRLVYSDEDEYADMPPLIDSDSDFE